MNRRRWALLFLCCALFVSARADFAPPPAGGIEANRQALALFLECAFQPEYGEETVQPLCRWEKEIAVWAGGQPTKEDLRTLDTFLKDLAQRVPGLPSIRRVPQDLQADIRVWFVPGYMMQYYVEGYVDGNDGFFHYENPGSKIQLARVAIASDLTEQEERNHLILEEMTGALGLPGDHLKYADSILYDRWTVTQTLSDLDWRMLNLLYSPVVHPGMIREDAKQALRDWLGV